MKHAIAFMGVVLIGLFLLAWGPSCTLRAVSPATPACRHPRELRDTLITFRDYQEYPPASEIARIDDLAGGKKGSEAYCACKREMIRDGQRIAPDAAQLSLEWMDGCWGEKDQKSVLEFLARVDDPGDLYAGFALIRDWGRSPKIRGAFVMHREFERLFESEETSRRFATEDMAGFALVALFSMTRDSSSGVDRVSPHALEIGRSFCARLPERKWGGEYCRYLMSEDDAGSK